MRMKKYFFAERNLRQCAKKFILVSHHRKAHEYLENFLFFAIFREGGWVVGLVCVCVCVCV
jgi:c-di-AMP phosphodiesterase-like protein